MKRLVTAMLCAAALVGPAMAQQAPAPAAPPAPAPAPQVLTWPGEFMDVPVKLQDGTEVGHVMLVGYPTGVFLQIDLKNIEDGAHGIHFHQVGQCVENFSSTGDHVNPTGAPHGFEAEGGPHAGDLMNVYVMNGVGKSDQFNDMVTLADLNDADGTSLLIYRSPDDYQTQPSGQQVGRLACAVVFPPK